MANFSTEFPIDQSRSIQDVIDLGRRWIVGSPHTRITEAQFPSAVENFEGSCRVGEESVVVAHAQTSDFEIGGIRYSKTEEQLEWTTSIVARKTAEQHLLSLQVVCEALSAAVRLPPPKKPYFIRQAISTLGGGLDGQIPVADRPFRLEEGEAHVAAALISGTANNRLPIVYISIGFDGQYAVNADDLARFVSGMAHVVVEPSRRFSNELRRRTSNRNVYGGGLGVYWPDSSGRRTYFRDQSSVTAKQLQMTVASDIRAALANRRLSTSCTWSHVAETVSRKRIETLKSRGSTDLQEYIDTFDADLKAKDARLSEAEAEIARLKSEVRKASSSSSLNAGRLLASGVEQDYFSGEMNDIVLDALEAYARTLRIGGRRQHVVEDLLRHNRRDGTSEKLKSDIKTLLRGYRDMDAKTRSALTQLGFVLTEDGKHIKATFHGDGRYMFTISKTSSDGRAGLNLASEINSQIF